MNASVTAELNLQEPSPRLIRDRVRNVDYFDLQLAHTRSDFKNWLGPEWIGKVLGSADRNTSLSSWHLIENDVESEDCEVLTAFLARPYVSGIDDRSVKDPLLDKLLSMSESVQNESKPQMVENLKRAALNILHIPSSEEIDEHTTDWFTDLYRYDLFRTLKTLAIIDPSKTLFINEIVDLENPIFNNNFIQSLTRLCDAAIHNSADDVRDIDFHTSVTYREREWHSTDHDVSDVAGAETALTFNGDDEEFILGPEEEALCNRVNSLVETFSGVESSAVPAFKLHFFNFFSRYPGATQRQIEEETRRLMIVSDNEHETSDKNNPLPTIGIEIEFPITSETAKIACILNKLEIPNYDAFNLREVNPDFSYSYLTQARIAEELMLLGMNPLVVMENHNRFQMKFPESDATSLHVNLGIPEGLKGDINLKYEDDFEAFVDAFTYAFSSPERIKRRKTSTSYNVNNDANKSKKHSDSDPNTMTSVFEIRTGELRDYPTFIALKQTQFLGAVLFSHLKEQEHIPLSSDEVLLSQLWGQFKSETQNILNGKSLTPSLYDDKDERDRIYEIMDKTDISFQFKKLYKQFYLKAKHILEDEKQSVPA